METNFASCLVFTQAEEGGYVADRRDSGNWTSGHVGDGVLVGSNMGVGAPTLLAWMGPDGIITAELMRNLRFSTYEAIARCQYWEPLGCGAVPEGIDLMLFDYGWNRGIATSLNSLAECLNVLREGSSLTTSATVADALQQISAAALLRQLARDGVRILQRMLRVPDDGLAGPQTTAAFGTRRDLRVIALILALSAAQVASYRLLANFAVYGEGWLARAARRQTTAVFLAQQAMRTGT